jgi:IS5 family transposase
MSQPRDDRQDDLFRPTLEEIINLRHPLVRLGAEIDWGFLAGRFGLSRRAWAAAIADAAGGWAVHSQAHAESVRRDAVRPVGGEPVFSVLLRRSGVPPRGAVRSLVANALATATGRGADCRAAAGGLSVAHRTGAIERKDLERVVVDTTVQEKAIAHPTDARLTHRAIEKLVETAKREGVELRRSYLRVAKRAAIMVGRYMHAQVQARSAGIKFLRTRLGLIIRDVRRKIEGDTARQDRFGPLLDLALRGSPSRAAPARTEGLLIARPRGGVGFCYIAVTALMDQIVILR